MNLGEHRGSGPQLLPIRVALAREMIAPTIRQKPAKAEYRQALKSDWSNGMTRDSKPLSVGSIPTSGAQGPIVYWLASEFFTLKDRVRSPVGLRER